MTLRLVVNADDLGASESVNQSVFDLAAGGTVTSATILTNAPAADGALNALERFPSVSFGVHLNLTEFEPIKRSTRLGPLLDDGGRFSPSAIRSVHIDAELRQAIFEEWCAQVGRVLAAGRTPSHFDSHHHVHTIPGLFPVLKRLQRRFGVRRIRLTKNLFGKSSPYTATHLIKKAAWNTALRVMYPTRTTDAFTSLEEFKDLFTRQKLARWLWPNRVADTTVEVMVHPGNPEFELENRLLLSRWPTEQGFELISYASV